MTAAEFRGSFPQFADPALFPSAQVDFWLALGARLMNPERWGDLLDYGLQLFAAHNLSLDAASSAASGSGGIPGAVIGPVSSASVDKVSYSRDSSSAMNPDLGHWNLTTYGMRWALLARMAGAGPVQVGVPLGASNAPYQAWPGVVPPPFG